MIDTNNIWSELARDERKRRSLERVDRIRENPCRTQKCPHCGAWALDLWHIYGLQYFECARCKRCAV